MKRPVSILLTILMMLPAFVPFVGASLAGTLHLQHSSLHHAHEAEDTRWSDSGIEDISFGAEPSTPVPDDRHLTIGRPEHAIILARSENRAPIDSLPSLADGNYPDRAEEIRRAPPGSSLLTVDGRIYLLTQRLRL